MTKILVQQYISDLKDYTERGRMPGNFLRAVLSNNLMGVMSHADEEAQKALQPLCQYIYSKMPSEAWGDEEKVYHYAIKKQKEHSK